ncbi:hypothetical protein Q5424_19925 [Conexibacter sp. JD483]|uniref:hypothetical protein n=1 Tax=unclassified Conexibacter TaxID=2627773 RepID=UPI00272800E8|nr:MULTISPECIES: hypothetical protein [unclassified Conexibacter]MDO8188772.1 hypothetical protein [Conexibacter sp. CPCC 205706]MDO8201717.1 hypothetical protein [Conexibacter sp. CPCC 205762]MDR9371378.1 hypothetical protein [Conexibacter sp. JD483]
MQIRGSLFLTLTTAVLLALAPAGARAAITVTAEEPFEETPYVPDLGTTTATVGDDGTLTVRTRIVARPPAGWGGCVPMPSGLCVPARITVSWLLDWLPGSGSVTEAGADAKIVATPTQGTTTWQALRWDPVLTRWSAAAVPAATTDIGGATWSLVPSQLGIPATATIAMPIWSRFHVVGDDGVPIDAADDAGPLTIPLGGLGAPRGDTAPTSAPSSPQAPAPVTPDAGAGVSVRAKTAACVAATRRLRTIEVRIKRLEAIARGRGTAARRRAARDELRRQRPRRSTARTLKRRACTPASQPRGL